MSASVDSKSESTVFGMIPGIWLLPVIVNVLPLPVAPYAKQHTLRPCSTSGSRSRSVDMYASS